MHYACYQLSRPSLRIPTGAKKCFRAIFSWYGNQCFPVSFLRACACCPFPTSPARLHRDNRLRSHPSHLTSTASIPTHPPPQSSNVRRLTPPPRRSSPSFHYLRHLVRILLLSHTHVPIICQAVDHALHRAETP